MEENKILAFLTKHWSKILVTILALACVGAWAERLFGDKNNQSKQDYLTVNKIFEQFQKGHVLPQDSIEEAKVIIKRHPELGSKFDAVLALSLFSEAKIAEALPFAESLIHHVDAQLPSLYKEYAYTTLLISKEEYAQAYDSSRALQKNLHEKPSYQKLEAMNTLRLVFLAEKMGDTEQKNVFWTQLKNHPGYVDIEMLFHEGNVSLEDYLKRV